MRIHALLKSIEELLNETKDLLTNMEVLLNKLKNKIDEKEKMEN
jgi:hypothetical protein